jgi:hypothetical protein
LNPLWKSVNAAKKAPKAKTPKAAKILSLSEADPEISVNDSADSSTSKAEGTATDTFQNFFKPFYPTLSTSYTARVAPAATMVTNCI